MSVGLASNFTVVAGQLTPAGITRLRKVDDDVYLVAVPSLLFLFR